MYTVRISIQGSDKFNELLPEDTEAAELTIETLVSSVLLELFGTINVDEVNLDYTPSDIVVKIPGEKSILYADIKSFNHAEKEIEAHLVNKTLAQPFSSGRVTSVVLEREEPSNSPVLSEALKIAKERTLAAEKEAPTPILHFRIMENPLTAQNFTIIISSLNELYTKCWLIAQLRFADLIEYTQAHNAHFAQQANLVITTIRHNSPAEIKMNVNADISAQGIAEALKTGIEAISLMPYRQKGAELANIAKELEIRQKELEAQSFLAEKEQNLQIEAQRAELDRQKTLIEIEKQKIEIEKQRLSLQKEFLDLETQRINFALETASKMVTLLYPNADEPSKAMILQSILPTLVQLSNGKGLELVLPSP